MSDRISDLEQQVFELTTIAETALAELSILSQEGAGDAQTRVDRRERVTILVDRCENTKTRSRQLAERAEQTANKIAKQARSKIVCLDGGTRETEPPPSNPKDRHLRIA